MSDPNQPPAESGLKDSDKHEGLQRGQIQGQKAPESSLEEQPPGDQLDRVEVGGDPSFDEKGSIKGGQYSCSTVEGDDGRQTTTTIGSKGDTHKYTWRRGVPTSEVKATEQETLSHLSRGESAYLAFDNALWNNAELKTVDAQSSVASGDNAAGEEA
jgi:hypothetical protein